jgi:hypothetical protein
MAETGRLDLGPLQNLMHPEQDDSRSRGKALAQMKFERGLGNPWRAFGKEAIPENIKVREEQSVNYAARAKTESAQFGVQLGAKTGPMPFDVDQTNQGDEKWWTKFKTTM